MAWGSKSRRCKSGRSSTGTTPAPTTASASRAFCTTRCVYASSFCPCHLGDVPLTCACAPSPLFFPYQADQAWTQQKSVWKDLHAFGYQNDLKRSPTYVRAAAPPAHGAGAPSAADLAATAAATAVAEAPSAGPAGAIPLPPLGMYLSGQCKWALCSYALFEVGLEPSESSAKAIFRRALAYDHLLSEHLVHHALVRLFRAACDVTWNQTNGIIEFFRVFVSVEDDLVAFRIRTLLLHEHVGLASVVAQVPYLAPI